MRKPQTASLAPMPASLDKKLLAYFAAISAACAASVANPQSAEAKVVYTPANRTILFNGKSILDLNNDHIADFVFNGGGLGNNSAEWVRPFTSLNHVFTGSLGSYWAAALPAGVTVGPGPDFTGHKAVMEAACFCSGTWDYTGPWLNAQNLYLGLEITVNGQHHFGWARFTFSSEVTLTGYAYETVPGKAIVTGATSDEQADAAPPPSPDNASAFLGMPSLGLLARGAATLDLWRRKEILH
jgi:hypothetical protein